MTRLPPPRAALAAVAALLLAAPARAYVDGAPTLAAIVNSSQTITVAEVERFSPEKGAVLLKKVRDLKGDSGAERIRHHLLRAGDTAVGPAILHWAEPGARCVLFTSAKATLVCTGRGWYQVHPAAEGWQRLGADRPELPLAYYGSASRLADAVARMLAGKSATITALQHGADRQAASFDLALNRAELPGQAKVVRMRASLSMPGIVMAASADPAFVVGQGPAGADEIPELRRKLGDADPAVRAEGAGELGSLGVDAAVAGADVAKLLDDPAPGVRMAAAAALARIDPHDGRAAEMLAKGLDDQDATVRRQAARAVGLAGPAAAPLADKLGALLADPDLRTRRAALQAVAALGPAAAGQADAVARLLGAPETALGAADALGRIGPAARPAMKRLAKMLESGSASDRAAALRAMAQIGGDDAAPAVRYMIRALRTASDVETYNMLIYLALLGPAAKDAVPAVQSARLINPVLRQATVWAIRQDGHFPWQGGDPFGRLLINLDFARWVYESYVQELGDRLKPAAATLARQIRDGTAGDVPAWGYELLARFPDDSLAVLTPGLESDQTVQRERAAVALGYMGPSAASAKGKVEEAVARATGDKERLLLRWCLRQMH